MTNKIRILEKLNILRGSIQAIIHSCVITDYLEEEKGSIVLNLIESRLNDLEQEIEKLEEKEEMKDVP